jgi:hypothetical protein
MTTAMEKWSNVVQNGNGARSSIQMPRVQLFRRNGLVTLAFQYQYSINPLLNSCNC